jgi:hypothetical protein
MESQFAREQRWRDQQARQNAEETRNDSGLTAAALCRLRTPPPPPEEPLDLAGLTLEEVSAIAQGLYRDANRLRRERDQARSRSLDHQPKPQGT